MFVGHYSASFLGKAAAPRVPLWILLLAAQLVDVAWAIFILLGVEHFHLDPTLPTNPLVLDHMPYTHSLLGTLAWAALGGAIVVLAGFGKTRAAVVTGLVVCSHWVLDVLVHRPDMTLVGSDAPFGLALWNRPVLAFVVEIAVLVGAAGFAMTRSGVGAAERRAVVRGVGVLVVLQIFTTFGPIPPSPTAMVLSVLATFLLIAWGAARMERRLAR